MSDWPPRVDYNLAVVQVCKQLKIDIFSREQTAKSNTGYTFSLRVWYQGHELQAFGTGLSQKKARMEASRNGLIQIVQRARMIGDPALSIKKCGLAEEDLSSSTGKLSDNLSAKAVDKSNSASKTKPKAVLKAKPVSSANQSISNSPSSSTSPQSVEFDYLAAVDRLKQTGSICTFKELTVQGIAETKFTFLLEVNHNGDKFQALGSATSKKNAQKDACKNGLMEMWLVNPALSLDECGLTKQDVADYNTRLLDLQVKLRDITNGPVNSTVSSTTSQSAQAKQGAVLTNTSNANQSLDKCPLSSITSQPAKFNYKDTLNRLMQNGGSFTLKELTDQSSISSLETKFIFVLQINHQGIEVHAFGSGPSKTRAKTEARKMALIKLVHRLKLSNPELPLESYGVTESELAEYERCTDKQANDSIAKTVFSLPNQTENAEIPADQTKQEEKSSAKALSVETLASPSISSSNRTGDDRNSTDKTPINCADLTAETLQNFGHSAKHSSALELALQVVLEKVEETIQDGHRFLKQNQDVFELLKRQEEDASRCYKTLIKRIIELSEDKLRYRFSLVDGIGFGQLFYEGLCIRTVSESCSQAASSSYPDLIALEESCARHMFDFIKLNCLG